MRGASKPGGAGAAWLLIGVLALSACGRQHGSANSGQATTTPATALNPPTGPAAPTATPAQREEAGLAPTQRGKVTQLNEDGSEMVEATTGDSGTHNPLLTAVASTMAASSSPAAAATTTAPTPWQDGVNYTRLVPAQPTDVPPGQIEVLEFFWYACPHCYAIDGQVEAWRKTKAAYISFSRVPVMWSEGHRSTARLFYTLKSLGKLDQLHAEVFKEIHVNNDPLIAPDPNDVAGAERVQAQFVAKFGISDSDFKKAYQSIGVETSLQRADELVQRYHIDAVPAVVIDGKYKADVRTAGSPERLLALIDDLTSLEHKH
jgi:thiol:disulfide interchange protein DsbA